MVAAKAPARVELPLLVRSGPRATHSVLLAQATAVKYDRSANALPNGTPRIIPGALQCPSLQVNAPGRAREPPASERKPPTASQVLTVVHVIEVRSPWVVRGASVGTGSRSGFDHFPEVSVTTAGNMSWLDALASGMSPPTTRQVVVVGHPIEMPRNCQDRKVGSFSTEDQTPACSVHSKVDASESPPIPIASQLAVLEHAIESGCTPDPSPLGTAGSETACPQVPDVSTTTIGSSGSPAPWKCPRATQLVSDAHHTLESDAIPITPPGRTMEIAVQIPATSVSTSGAIDSAPVG
jgi:hypothetical protein